MALEGSTVDDYKSSSSIVRDAEGQLFDEQSRQMLEPLVGAAAMRRLEMFAALRWLSRLMHEYVDSWANGHGLSESRFQILMQLKHQDSVPLGKLAARLRVTPRAVTALVDQLERDGMVVRVADPKDRRTIRAQMTPTGRKLFDKIWTEYLDIPLQLVDGVEQDTLDEIRSTCLELVGRIEDAGRGKTKKTS
ncbi:MarR family winged helix-turn-helix transcriptional regulator [Kribbella solani]|uniref:DNA-binding MarR family transcriptional regulator n=1 Tax=Kribbella solani TaxID=236067 RepID=A0A841DXS5_9ACTN|nr:MarR family transcriptional regulator [Kribbella solani]MBB5980038.1 DNA-binding MarR family transcriptional regulator [Kribbella solani]